MIKQAKIFFDADALIAGSASQTGATFLLLQLCELGILQGLTCEQAIAECRRNLQAKLPAALPIFEEVIQRSVAVYQNPSTEVLQNHIGLADEKDLPILVAALEQGSDYLVTFNIKDYYPPTEMDIIVCQPGELLQTIRKLLNALAD